MMDYIQFKTCRKCGTKTERSLDEETAAFVQTRQWSITCPNCNSKILNEGCNTPPLTYDLLKKWARNDSLQFIEQDEDIILADNNRLGLLLDIFDSDKTTEYKRGIIIQALCVLLYDNLASKEDNPESDRKIADRIVRELNERKNMVKLGKGQFIEPYIEKVVFPVIGFEIAWNI